MGMRTWSMLRLLETTRAGRRHTQRFVAHDSEYSLRWFSHRWFITGRKRFERFVTASKIVPRRRSRSESPEFDSAHTVVSSHLASFKVTVLQGSMHTGSYGHLQPGCARLPRRTDCMLPHLCVMRLRRMTLVERSFSTTHGRRLSEARVQSHRTLCALRRRTWRTGCSKVCMSNVRHSL